MGTEEQLAYLLWVERGAILIEALAIVVIIGFVLIAAVTWVARGLARRELTLEHYNCFRSRLGRALLLGLEMLVAADVIRTVALEPTLVNTATLGLLVVIRTFLSWSIVLEIEGRWPWQPRSATDSEEKNV